MLDKRIDRQAGRQSELRKAEESFEVEEVEFDPTRRGYTPVPNYSKHFWTPLIGLKAAATYELLCSFAHGKKDECYPSVGLLADILGVDKHDLTGRVRRDRRPGRRPQYYQKGMFQILAEHGLAKATVEERNGNKHYRFRVLKAPPLLTSDQIARLPERLQRRHRELLERCQREKEEFIRTPTEPLLPVGTRAPADVPAPVNLGGGDAATGGGDAATGGGDAATPDLNTTYQTVQTEQLSLTPAPQERELVQDFYRKIGQPRITHQKLAGGMKTITDLKGQGFSLVDIIRGVTWIATHTDRFGGEVHSLSLLPQVIGQALQEREKVGKSEEKRMRQAKEEQRLKAEQDRRQELEALYRSLPSAEQAALREVAVENLLQGGMAKRFLLEPLVRGEVYRMLEKKCVPQGTEQTKIVVESERAGLRNGKATV
jgi:hypothetical protein